MAGEVDIDARVQDLGIVTTGAIGVGVETGLCSSYV